MTVRHDDEWWQVVPGGAGCSFLIRRSLRMVDFTIGCVLLLLCVAFGFTCVSLNLPACVFVGFMMRTLLAENICSLRLLQMYALATSSLCSINCVTNRFYIVRNPSMEWIALVLTLLPWTQTLAVLILSVGMVVVVRWSLSGNLLEDAHTPAGNVTQDRLPERPRGTQRSDSSASPLEHFYSEEGSPLTVLPVPVGYPVSVIATDVTALTDAIANTESNHTNADRIERARMHAFMAGIEWHIHQNATDATSLSQLPSNTQAEASARYSFATAGTRRHGRVLGESDVARLMAKLSTMKVPNETPGE